MRKNQQGRTLFDRPLSIYLDDQLITKFLYDVMRGAFFIGGMIMAAFCGRLQAGCSLPEDESIQFDDSRAVVKAQVISAEPFLTETGVIRTRFVLHVVESYKGDAPETFEITSTGGKIGTRITHDSASLDLKTGKSYVLLLTKEADGSWSAAPHQAFNAPAERPEIQKFFRGKARGPKPKLVTAAAAEALATETTTTQANSGVPSSVVTSTGYVHDSNGHPARFTSCDGDEPIPYVVDVDTAKLPSGMDQAAALAAVQEALNSWASASSASFRFAGTQSFGTAAGSIAATDKIIRIQLHDTYNFITNAGILGVGGGSSSIDSSVFYGGKIGTQGFQERSSAYVVLNHRAAFMATAVNFKQVLTHELGHALGLAHSSENSSEPNAILKGATMYYTTSNDGRGTNLTVYDQDRIAFGYSTTNRPPYTVDRLIPGVTCGLLSSLPLVPGCNQIRLKAVDYEGASVTPTLTSATNVAGAMTLNGNTLKFVPSGNFLDSLLTDLQISQGYNYGKAIVQFSDGVNLSRAAVCQVSSIYQDTTPSDGLPDSWMMANFGTKAVGAVGSGRNPDDDPDKDGLTNRLEFYMRTNPNSAASGRLATTYNHATRQFTFIPQQFAPYAIEASGSLVSGSWTTRRLVTRFDTSTSSFSIPVDSATSPTQEYYRVVVGP